MSVIQAAEDKIESDEDNEVIPEADDTENLVLNDKNQDIELDLEDNLSDVGKNCFNVGTTNTKILVSVF